ncbi:MAG: DUF4145 domain-containing protein [Caulobacteraceae bacterium]|nr:MAG: DUF4145 domain-containing protein [Caulobacteraceae bacterium]
MAIELTQWKKGFRNLPAWPCPTCATGRLTAPEKLTSIESGPSKKAHEHDAWEPEWIESRFIGMLKCNNSACEEICAISGYGGIDFDHEYDEEFGWTQVWVDYYHPIAISPSPPIFPVVPDWPEPVKKALQEAFGLFWSDLDSCANKLRAAVEALLNDRGVPNFTQPIKGKKRAQLNLHTRIERFKSTEPIVAELLMAIKWIGNHGSHAGEGLRREDILTSAELMEHALTELYKPANNAIKKALAINKKKGPVPPPKRKRPPPKPKS